MRWGASAIKYERHDSLCCRMGVCELQVVGVYLIVV